MVASQLNAHAGETHRAGAGYSEDLELGRKGTTGNHARTGTGTDERDAVADVRERAGQFDEVAVRRKIENDSIKPRVSISGIDGRAQSAIESGLSAIDVGS